MQPRKTNQDIADESGLSVNAVGQFLRGEIITTGRAGGLHRPPWGLLPAEPIGSSNYLRLHGVPYCY